MNERQWNQLMESAVDVVEATLRELPEALRAPATQVPVLYERKPNRMLVSDGIEPDVLGLFVGPEFSEELMTSHPLPAQILLFLENLWEFSEEDTKTFREEVRTTDLHELGHYLGLDEEDLADRGLE
jgi:predicted Zn-dependent protease with MMP-like domain